MLSFLKNRFIDFFLIFGGILLINAFNMKEGTVLTVHELRMTALCAICSDLPSFILYNIENSGKWGLRIRMLLHFVVLEIVIISFSFWAEFVSTWKGAAGIAIMVVIIYVFVALTTWFGRYNEAKRINKQIQHRKKADNQFSENTLIVELKEKKKK